MDSTRETVQAAPEPQLAVRQQQLGPDPLIGMGLAVLVAVAVFWILLRIRRAFGMK